MSEMVKTAFVLNGVEQRVEAEARTSLADVLRERFGQTGTHLGCEHGVCGACTVAMDGRIVRSCTTLAAVCGGARIETVQGLDEDPVLRIVQQAFHECHGLQCGFCTPGMLMTVRDMLLRDIPLDEARIRHELSGNLCRCTGYAGIVRAVQLADERWRQQERERQ